MFNLPQKVVIEKDAVKQISLVQNGLHLGNRCMVICDKNLKHVGEQIDGELVFPDSLEKTYLNDFSIELKNYDYAVGVGGGRIIDLSKYASFLAGKPWISFPTILSHDGVVSNRAAITDNEAKVSVDAKEPVAIVVDTEIIKNAPYRFMAAGAADLVSNITSVKDWQLGAERGEKYSTIVAELALIPAKAVMSHSEEIRQRTEHGIYTLVWSLICSGMAMNINGSSRPASGSEHNFSHAMEKLSSPLLHGEHCAIGTLVSSYLQNGNWKEIKNTLEKLDVLFNINQFPEKITEDMLIDALVMAKDIRGYERHTILDRIDIDKEKAKAILQTVGVI
jgi:glycerol-1-phosphate dehydrogenase [NAD(P)+]